MEDEQIVELLFARSEKALAALAEKYGGVCLRTAENILGSRRDAEECVNDAYLAVWDTVPPARPQPLLTYVCRITRNLALKKRRANAAAKRNAAFDAALDELEECIPAPDSVEDEVFARETALRINAFLEALDRENRILFVRRYWYGDSVGALAERLGCGKHNVSVRLSRLRKSLKAWLTKEEAE